LNGLAINKHVTASTQNQALCALVFLYRTVLEKEPGYLSGLEFAKRPSKLPVVFTQDEVRLILGYLSGTYWVIGNLFYGSGLIAPPGIESADVTSRKLSP